MSEDSTSTSSTSSKQLAVSQPSRGADRNQNLVDKSDPRSENILLPSLDDGITLLDIDGGRGVPILQSIVLDHLLMHDGPAFWVDANGHAITTALARLATYAEGYDILVLVTRTKPDEFTASVITAAEYHLECEQTRMGPRFVGDEFETLVYPVDGGAYYQTTLAYWRQGRSYLPQIWDGRLLDMSV